MTDTEKQIIDLINNNQHLSEELKKRYILAMFLMESRKQREYLDLMQAFTKRCKETERGIFVVHPSDKKSTLRTYEDVKKDIFKKLNIS